jgi:fatty acid desaturase
MKDQNYNDGVPLFERFHPLVYRTVIGLVCCLVLSVWGFFGGGYTALVLVVVSAFIFVAVMIPYLLWRISRNPRDPRNPRSRTAEASAWREWRAGDVATHTGRLSGASAATELLLPLAAVAFSMTAFALVHYLAVVA